MIPVKLIIIVGLVCLFVGVTFFRMYLRTDLKGYLLISLGAVIGLIGGIISYLGNLTGGLGSSDREQRFISGKLPCVKIHAAACFCDSVLK
jgi:protein-S-isoprenylcysteine O-methyltransferase Ste14